MQRRRMTYVVRYPDDYPDKPRKAEAQAPRHTDARAQAERLPPERARPRPSRLHVMWAVLTGPAQYLARDPQRWIQLLLNLLIFRVALGPLLWFLTPLVGLAQMLLTIRSFWATCPPCPIHPQIDGPAGGMWEWLQTPWV